MNVIAFQLALHSLVLFVIIEQPIPLTAAGTAWLDDDIGLPLLVSGPWTVEMLSSSTLGAGQGRAATFIIQNADGTIDTVATNSTTPAPGINIIDSATTVAPIATNPPIITVAPSLPTPTSAP